MSKKNFSGIRALTASAMMAALSIILERILALMPASNMMDIRISLSNVPIILCGVLVSPVMGALAGVVSDIVGCFISGYAPFPILTAAPLLIGIIPGLILGKHEKYPFLKVMAAITISHLLASFLVTTYGLCIMRGTYFVPMLITRLPSCFANLAIDVCLVYLLLKTKSLIKL